VNKTGDDQYSIQLTKQGDEFSFFVAGSRQYKVRVDPKALAAVQRQFERAVDNATSNPDAPEILLQPFEQLGRGLFDVLLPSRQVEDLRRELGTDDSPLLIITDDPDPLWEYMNDGVGPGVMCLKRDVGRSLLKTDVSYAQLPRPERKWRCLMVADPTSDLEDAEEEATQLRPWFEQRDVDCSAFLLGEDATYDNVIEKLLGGQWDIIHYAGHVRQDPQGDYCMLLNGGEYLTPDNIKTFVKGGSIVFLNGCNSARAVKGLADAFISVGARVVLGTLFATPDQGSRGFAETFYSCALSGKPVGEAVRLARKSVMGDSRYAAAWACFVMYGDPTLRLDLRVDELQNALRGSGLSRGDFEPSAARVIEKAVEFGTPVGNVSTAHLFAAMVAGEDPHLRDRLRDAGVPPKSLQSAFQQVFHDSGLEGGANRHGNLDFSPNALTILEMAQRSAQAEQRPRIGEMDLVGGFVARGGGGAGEILRHLGVNINDLGHGSDGVDGDSPPGAGAGGVVRVGSLTSADCSPEAWRALLAAANIAARSGSEHVSSPHIFWGLNQDPGGAMARALQRLRVSLSFGGHLPPLAVVVPAEVRCSKNAGEVLLQAQARAVGAERLVTDQDLLTAFVRSDGGGQFLEKKGLILDALASHLFLEDGGLDLTRFDEAAQTVIDGAIDCAYKKRYSILGRRHLLYGMLVAAGGLLPRRVADQGQDAELLADQIYAAMETGSTSVETLRPAYNTMSGDLVRVFCQAEHLAEEESAPAITDGHVLRAWLADGGGEMGVFLARSGVRLRRLL